jgi:hypothetical protein
MDSQGTIQRISIFLLLFLSLVLFACSYPSWLPFKKGAPRQAKANELLDKEIVIIDREKYIKVVNPNGSENPAEPKFLYIPIATYESRREAYAPVSFRGGAAANEISPPPKAPPRTEEKEVLVVSAPGPRLSDLRRKVVIAHVDDRTEKAEEPFGDIITEKLMKDLDARTRRVLLVDHDTVRALLEKGGLGAEDLAKPSTTRFMNESFGIHALALITLSGPYVFTSKAPKDSQETASAIVRIEVTLINTLTGKTLKTFSVNNPILAARQKGTFSDEKAKMKAIDLVVAELGRSLAREIDNLDWFCRIAKVETEEVYLNAGKVSGLKVGDILEVVKSGNPGDRESVKGRIRITAYFGVDASIGQLVQGNQPHPSDILRLASRESR